MKNACKSLVFIMILVGLSSCATFHEADRMERQVAAKIDQSKIPQAQPVVQSLNVPYLRGPSVRPSSDLQVPESLKQNITLLSAVPLSLRQVAAKITQITGIACEVQDSGTRSEGQGIPVSGAPTALSSALSSLSGNGGTAVSLHYHGPLNGLLDVICAQTGYFWKFKEGGIQFFRTETKTFLIPAFAGKTTSTNSISSNNGTSGTTTGTTGTGVEGGGGSSAITNTTDINDWRNMAKIAKTVADGGRIFVDSSLGTITVTGTPPQVDAVADWVHSLTRQLSKQIAIEIHVYDLDLTNEQNYGFNPTLAFQSLAKQYGFSVEGANAPNVVSTQATPMTIGASILDSATGAVGQWGGTGVVAKALATMGKIVSSYSRSAVTTNGQPAAIQVASNTGYLASTSTTLAANVGSTASLTPGMVTTGFTAFITPRIIGNEIYLGINMTISTLLKMQTITSNGQSIQTPNTASFAEQQNARLKSGDILVLTGYQQDDASVTKNGSGSPDFPLLGGGADATASHRMIVITVTARTV